MKESHIRQLVRSELLREVSEGSLLYHRSEKELEPGQVIDGEGHGRNAHRQKSNAEKAFEKFRSRKFPGLPSRFDAVFLSPTPRSRFNKMGDLYTAKIKGRYHVADSRMFDAYREHWQWPIESKQDAVRCYWDPGSVSGCPELRNVNPKYIEVVAESAVIVEKIAEDFLSSGDKIEIVESPPVAVQKGQDGTSDDPEVWADHPKIKSVWDGDDNFHYAQPKKGSVWTVIYAGPTDSARQQNTIKSRGGDPGMNHAKDSYKKIHLRDGKVSPMYGSHNDSIEKLVFKEVS